MSVEPANPIDLGRDAASGLDVSLVPMTPAEAQRLGPIFASIDPWASYPYPAAALVRYLAQDEPGAPRHVIRLGDDAVGAAGLRLNWLRGPYLQFLAIAPGYQGRGLGGRVLAWMDREAAARGDRNLWVCASDFNDEGIKFYKRHGFVVVASIDDLVQESRAEILLRKRLGESKSA